MQNIELCNYVDLTPIQKQAIPLGLAGRDMLCSAQTGSGKTAAFLLPAISAIATADAKAQEELEAGFDGSEDEDGDESGYSPALGGFDEAKGVAAPEVVVLAPTRELAAQINMEARKLCFDSPVRTVELYGGAPARGQMDQLARGAQLVVATPGRLTDFIERGIITMEHVKTVVMDEADRMLDMGFEPQVRRIVEGSGMPSSKDGRQTLLFSATMPRKMQTLTRDFTSKSVAKIEVGVVGAASKNITQRVMLVDDAQHKFELVNQLLEEVEGPTLVFVNTKLSAEWLGQKLWQDSRVPSTAIHGDLTQGGRNNSLRRFKNGQARVMIGTDVAARGLDIDGVTHVINFDIPEQIDDYVHRIGRTGRAGHQGTATALFLASGRHSCVGLAPSLAKLLGEAEQEIPDWLEEYARKAGYGKGGGGGRRGGGGGKGKRQWNGGGGRGGKGGGGSRSQWGGKGSGKGSGGGKGRSRDAY